MEKQIMNIKKFDVFCDELKHDLKHTIHTNTVRNEAKSWLSTRFNHAQTNGKTTGNIRIHGNSMQLGPGGKKSNLLISSQEFLYFQ